jgi:hypothetical protein
LWSLKKKRLEKKILFLAIPNHSDGTALKNVVTLDRDSLTLQRKFAVKLFKDTLFLRYIKPTHIYVFKAQNRNIEIKILHLKKKEFY